MNARTVHLEKVCNFIRGVTFDKAETTNRHEVGMIPILRAGNIGDELDSQNDLIWVPENLVSEEQRLRKNDIAICMSSGSPEVVGKTARVPNNLHASIGSFCGIIRPKNPDEASYLSFFFRSLAFRKHRDAIARGANIQNLRFSQFGEIELEIPSEQKQIAGLLERAERLCRIRRYSLVLSTTFLQATFFDKFGDPVRNTQGWNRARVCDLGYLQTGNTPSREDSTNYGNAIEWIKSDNIILGELYPTRSSEMLSKQGMTIGRVVDKGSLLLTCIAGSATTIGNVCLTDRRVSFNQQINSVTPHKGVLPLFLYGLFLTIKPLIQRSTTLAMKRMITKSKLAELLLILPPETLQKQFSQLVERHEQVRVVQREALRQAEHLFQTLLHQTFAGV